MSSITPYNENIVLMRVITLLYFTQDYIIALRMRGGKPTSKIAKGNSVINRTHNRNKKQPEGKILSLIYIFKIMLRLSSSLINSFSMKRTGCPIEKWHFPCSSLEHGRQSEEECPQNLLHQLQLTIAIWCYFLQTPKEPRFHPVSFVPSVFSNLLIQSWNNILRSEFIENPFVL